jgi:hypothetical protein
MLTADFHIPVSLNMPSLCATRYTLGASPTTTQRRLRIHPRLVIDPFTGGITHGVSLACKGTGRSTRRHLPPVRSMNPRTNTTLPNGPLLKQPITIRITRMTLVGNIASRLPPDTR